MHWQKKVGSAVLGMTAVLFGWSSSSQAQVFDTPVLDFVLEQIPAASALPIPNLPLTLNVGNFDPTIVGTGDQTLNEVVVAGVSQLVDGDPVALDHRYWTIVHDSATDTRSLVQTNPSDILVTTEADPFYLFPDSLQLLDLNGDNVDDIGLLGGVEEVTSAINVSGVKLEKSGASGSVGVFGVPSQAGPNFFETSINLLGQQTDSSIPGLFGGSPSQPSLTTADFDGDGSLDLAFYDFIVGNPSIQVAVTLRNNGSFGTLPRTDTTLNLPADLQGADFAYNLVAADIDGDGPPDLAITFDPDDDSGIPDRLLVFKGNGDGTFVPDPIASATIGTDVQLTGLAVGNFDGDDFLDFAVGSSEDTDTVDITQLNIILCNGGATCAVNPVVFVNQVVTVSLAAADFDEDGADDLAAAFITCANPTGNCQPNEVSSGVGVLINQGGGTFTNFPQQILPLGGAEVARFTLQVIGKDIDGCGGPDLAYTGLEFPEPTPSSAPTGQGIPAGLTDWASVAFNHNDDPIADAGTPVAANGGVQVGGDPTCTGELGEVLNIEWEVVSGDATISDPTAANPIVNANSDAVLQVTCSDLCGASSSATITVQGGGLLLNGSGCSLGFGAGGGNFAWLLVLGAWLPLAFRRFRR